MIRLGLRLTFAGGREAITRLALITVAVAIGVGLLLATLAGLNAVNNQNARYAWLETGYTSSHPAATAQADALWWQLRADYFDGNLIGRVDLAATGPGAPVPPGIAALPAPGQYYASPALGRLLRTTPVAQLGDRYPGRLVGTIGPAALPSPNSLIIIIGRTTGALAHRDGVELVNRINTTAPNNCTGPGCDFGIGINHNGIVLILAVVIAALLFPVLVFIGGATRLSAARREQRFAAMRLVGATPRQVAVICTVESSVATVIGVAGGFGLFSALRPAIATIPFTGDPFFTGDLSLSPADVLLVALGIPIGAAVAARMALRRVSIFPLGVSRRVTPRPPRAWRLLPLLAGIAELAYFAYVRDIGARTDTNTTVEALVFLAGVLLVMAGLVTAGPLLTMLGARLAIRRASRPATLVAARRLGDNPQAAFRAVSGLVLALFVGTCATAIITAIAVHGNTASGLGAAAGSTLVELSGPQRQHTPTAADTATANTLASTPGVTGVAVIHARPMSVPAPMPGMDAVQDVVSCTDLANVPALGRCQPGATTAVIAPDYAGGFALGRAVPMRERVWTAAGLPESRLRRLPIDSIAVGTDGSPGAIERARTVLDLAYPTTFPPQTGTEMQGAQTRLLDDYERLADVVILTSLPIAGSSLAVSVAGGLIERKRPFSLLRLAGAPLGVLRRVIGLESVVPLLITAAASAGAGFLAAHLFLRAQLNESLQAPGLSYYTVVVAGLTVALGVIASTLPLLGSITGPETARNE